MSKSINGVINALKLYKQVKDTKVNDSPASEMEKEIRRVYPQVKITRYSKNGWVELRFDNFPHQNDFDQTKDTEWTRFLRHIYKKHVSEEPSRMEVSARAINYLADVPDLSPNAYDSVKDSLPTDVVDKLIAEEESAIKSYDEAIAQCNDDKEKEVLQHIRAEEVEHVKELEELKSSKFPSHDSIESFKVAYHGTKTDEIRDNIIRIGFDTPTAYFNLKKYDAQGYGQYLLQVDLSSLRLKTLSDAELEQPDWYEQLKYPGYDGIAYSFYGRGTNIEVFNTAKLNAMKSTFKKV